MGQTFGSIFGLDISEVYLGGTLERTLRKDIWEGRHFGGHFGVIFGVDVWEEIEGVHFLKTFGRDIVIG